MKQIGLVDNGAVSWGALKKAGKETEKGKEREAKSQYRKWEKSKLLENRRERKKPTGEKINICWEQIPK